MSNPGPGILDEEVIVDDERALERRGPVHDEVHRMRAAVEAMGGDVGELRGGMEDVTRITHPLRRLHERRRRDGS